MEIVAKKHSIFKSIWFWWFITTAIYSIGTGYGSAMMGESHVVEKAIFALGLFVPYGPLSLLLFIETAFLSSISVLFFCVVMVYANKFLKNKNLSTGRTVFYIFLILLVLTTFVDIIRGTPFVSWKFLILGINNTIGF